MNSNTSPLRDESQLLTDAQILGIGRSEVANMHRVDETDWLDFARAIEAEVRSLRSQEPTWDAITEANKRYGPLVRAVISLLCAVEERHDEQSPLKYTIPYGAVNALRVTLGMVESASPPSQPIASDVVAALRDMQNMLDFHGELKVVGDTTMLAWSKSLSVIERALAAPDALIAAAQELLDWSWSLITLERPAQTYLQSLIDKLRAALAEQSEFRVLKTGEGPQSDAATSPDVLSRQSPVEADTQRSAEPMSKELADAISAAFQKASACSMPVWFEGRNEYEGSSEQWEAHEAAFDAWRTPVVAASPSDTSQGVSEAICQSCHGSGEGKCMTWGHGPDDYEVDCPCKDCDGTGIKRDPNSWRQALEFAASTMSRNWPDRCQEIVRRARAALRSEPTGEQS